VDSTPRKPSERFLLTQVSLPGRRNTSLIIHPVQTRRWECDRPGVEPTSSECMTRDCTTHLKRSAVMSATGIHRLIDRDICVAATAHNTPCSQPVTSHRSLLSASRAYVGNTWSELIYICILFRFSLVCEYGILRYVRTHVLYRVNQAEYAIVFLRLCHSNT